MLAGLRRRGVRAEVAAECGACDAGTFETLQAVLGKAVAACPDSVVLWLMYAKEYWLAGNVPAARTTLEAAHRHNPESEQVMLAAYKVEFENGEPERARALALRAKDVLPEPSARVWMKAAIAARELGHTKARPGRLACMHAPCRRAGRPQPLRCSR